MTNVFSLTAIRSHIHYLNLLSNQLDNSFNYLINYHQVKPAVYLPTTYDVTLTINTMGVKGSGKYYASVKYNSVEVDEIVFTDKHLEDQLAPQQKEIATELEKLSQKEQLSTREAYKMSKLMNEMVEPEIVKEQRVSLEIKEIERIKMEVDTLAWKRDSTFWSNIRVLPLREDEISSYQLSDSLSCNDTGAESDGGVNEVVLSVEEKPKKIIGKFIQGGMWQMNDKLTLRYGGLMGALKEYNFVDGFWLGQTVSLKYDIDKKGIFLFLHRYITPLHEENGCGMLLHRSIMPQCL